MYRFKKTATIFMAICLVFLLSACSGGNVEYESTQGFEFHFYPEEYEEEYSEAWETLSLNANMDYQLQIEATCESGTMGISIVYKDAEEKAYTVNADAPCNELLTIPANATSEVTIAVYIEPDTKGEVIGALVAPAR